MLSSGSSPHRKSESRRAKKEEAESFHHHWRVGVHRHNATLYIKLPGGRVQTLKGEKEELRITVVEARGLPQMDMGAGTTEEERAQGIGVSCDHTRWRPDRGDEQGARPKLVGTRKGC